MHFYDIKIDIFFFFFSFFLKMFFNLNITLNLNEFFIPLNQCIISCTHFYFGNYNVQNIINSNFTILAIIHHKMYTFPFKKMCTGYYVLL